MRLLLLAGTWEARQIAAGLMREPRIVALASLARAERRPVSLGIPTRIGGFGGDEAFSAWLAHERIDAILDATHPFAEHISHRSAAAAAAAGIDFIQFLRPAWLPTEGDDWTFVHSESDVARHVRPHARVFLATGRKRLEDFATLRAAHIYCRRTDFTSEPFPLDNGSFLQQRPPFSIEDEVATLSNLGVDWLVARNSGGIGSRAKLEAARELGIKVAMIRRPPQPPGPKVETVAEALAWVQRRIKGSDG